MLIHDRGRGRAAEASAARWYVGHRLLMVCSLLLTHLMINSPATEIEAESFG